MLLVLFPTFIRSWRLRALCPYQTGLLRKLVVSGAQLCCMWPDITHVQMHAPDRQGRLPFGKRRTQGLVFSKEK
jgi:hypothetical protein